MTDSTDRIAEVLRDELAESFKYSLRFGRKWIDTGPEAVDVEGWAAHVAEQITAALGLTEETERVQCLEPGCTWSFGCGHDGRRSRLVSAWSVALEQP